jgi:extensin-like protein
MARSVWPKVAAGAALFSLAGCGWLERAERPAWRAQAENACFERGLVRPSASIAPLPEIDGPGICGMTRPLKLAALTDGAVSVDKPVTIDCPMVSALEGWLADVVQPYAQQNFGENVVELEAFGAYSCRTVDNLAGAQLSEHAFGNAIDVSGFRLADGREISIVRDWKRSDTQEAAFLREIHAGACQHFTTVLGPGADVFHYNHFHLDLAMHGTTSTGPRRYCKPTPPPDLQPPPGAPDGLPPAPNFDEPMDVARASMKPSWGGPLDLRGPAVGAPPVSFEVRPAPAPVLPADDDVDNTPTSAIPLSRDD